MDSNAYNASECELCFTKTVSLRWGAKNTQTVGVQINILKFLTVLKPFNSTNLAVNQRGTSYPDSHPINISHVGEWSVENCNKQSTQT